MMQRQLFLLVFSSLSCSVAASCLQAQTVRFPYQARVVAQEAWVRSGGEEKYYPTQVLKKDTIVTVRQHDPGGWFKIDPPVGSFSWILEQHVGQISGQQGTVTTENAVVSVGSAFGDEISVWQRSMLSGEKVTILGRKVIDTPSGPQRMLKIKPPNREYRWVSGQDVIPLDERIRKIRDNDPYVVPSDIVERMANEPADAPKTRPAEQSLQDPVTQNGYRPSRQLARLQQLRKEQRALSSLDQEFRLMLLEVPSRWDLDRIEQKYLKLQSEATYPPLSGQIDLRYPAIQRYRIRKAEYEDFQRLTSSTEKRDAQLMAQQYDLPISSGSDAGNSTNVATGPMNTDGSSLQIEPGVQLEDPAIASLMIPSETGTIDDPAGIGVTMTPQTESTVPSAIANSMPNLQLPENAVAGSVKVFVGAGVVQRNPEKTGQFLLTTPAGKVLAHLRATDNLDLEHHVGQSVGVQGNRSYDQAIQADRIDVSALETVRLK